MRNDSEFLNSFLSRKAAREHHPQVYPKQINNSELVLKNFYGIHIENFRTLSNVTFKINPGVTVLSGYNGTLKSTVLGLFVQGFNSHAKDLFGNELKTSYREIFRLSEHFDKKRYQYDYLIEDENDVKIKIPVYTRTRSKEDASIRMVTGGATSFDGNMNLPTRYINLNRLLSIHTSKAKPFTVKLSDEEAKRQKRFYNTIFPQKKYDTFSAVSDKDMKNTFGPLNDTYDYTSISSGEDNLGSIFNSLVAFERIKSVDTYCKGILCIDEIEASLHPSAQINLLDYLNKWAKQQKMLVVVTTHSLGLLKHLSEKGSIKHYYFSNLYDDEQIRVHDDPPYELVYEEMTLSTREKDEVTSTPKVKVICEDDKAIYFLQRLIRSTSINDRLEFVSISEGIGYPQLISFYNKARELFDQESLIVVDGDVPQNALTSKKIDLEDLNSSMMRLPGGPLNLCYESYLAYDILSRDKSDPLFDTKMKKPKVYFSSYFNKVSGRETYDAFLENPSKEGMSKIAKRFVEQCPEIKKYRVNFIQNLPGKKDFNSLLLKKLNRIAEYKGYPLFVP